jgi:hypothetical protein
MNTLYNHPKNRKHRAVRQRVRVGLQLLAILLAAYAIGAVAVTIKMHLP